MRKHTAIITILLFWLLFFQEAGKEYYIPNELTEIDCRLLKTAYESVPLEIWESRGVTHVGPFACITMPSRSSDTLSAGEKIAQGLSEVFRQRRRPRR